MFNYTIDPVNVLCDFSFCFWYELECEEKMENKDMKNKTFQKYLFSKKYIADVKKIILNKAKSSRAFKKIFYTNGNINLRLFQENFNNINHIMGNLKNEIIKKRAYKTDEKDFYLLIAEIYKNIYENLYIYKYSPKIIQSISENVRSMESHVFKLFLALCLDKNRAFCADNIEKNFECCSESALKKTLKRLKGDIYKPYFIYLSHENLEDCTIYKNSISTCYSNLVKIEMKMDNEFLDVGSRFKMKLMMKPKNELLLSIKNDLNSKRYFLKKYHRCLKYARLNSLSSSNTQHTNFILKTFLNKYHFLTLNN